MVGSIIAFIVGMLVGTVVGIVTIALVTER